jgi:hypothetical protein
MWHQPARAATACFLARAGRAPPGTLRGAATIATVATPILSFLETLQPHPAQPGSVDMGLQAQGRWCDATGLSLCYTVRSPHLARIRLPRPRTPGPADGLWQHTCFELFIAAMASDAYLEYNLSPSGEWARYVFSAERIRDPLAEGSAQPTPSPIPIRCATHHDRISLHAVVPLADLPPSPQGWRVGLTAVIEDTDGRLGYWALHHPRPQPDFHHPAGRLLRLAPPSLS